METDDRRQMDQMDRTTPKETPTTPQEKRPQSKTESQGEARRPNPPASQGTEEDSRFAQPDNYDNAGRDQQQIMDDNYSQYVTGKPN
ncbi:MAG: hypothetical protein NDI61_11330 [Bdellovibrionaceae bacterium]|nr:hypothetical protein [Pseudobdellovibrionaceae bacterium]